MTMASSPIATSATGDAYFGLENPTPAQWEAWHRAMLAERAAVLARAKFDSKRYEDPSTAWSDTTFRQLFLFMYDASFYDRVAGRYRTAELLDRWMEMYGRVDSVLLWHAYPRVGFDSRTQFDFYRQMPGGIAKLRAQVADVLHRRGIRVFIDYNPWDAGTYDALADIAFDLDADGVMLDTMTELPDALARAVDRRKRGVVFAPELRPRDADLRHVRQSWAQWFDVGDAGTPSIYRHRWLVPQHRQFAIARWDTSRKRDIVYSFFNGSGLILWDNVFGTYNPYCREDRRLIAETAAVLDAYQDLFAHGEWLPLIPTGVAGLDANQWVERPERGRRAIVTLRNRTSEPLQYRVPPAAHSGMVSVAFWGHEHEFLPGDSVTVEPGGVQALVFDAPAAASRAVAHFERLSRRADVSLPDSDERCPRPRRLVEATNARKAPPPSARSTGMIELPAGTFDMRTVHERRECGCYPLGSTDAAMWGWFYKDILRHEVRVTLKRFAIRSTAVTNADFLEFVHATGYWPEDAENFIRHVIKSKFSESGLPARGTLPSEVACLPVTFVSLADARAYAAWQGQRLPTEAEWQWAAEGAGRRNRYPWGDEERTVGGELRAAIDGESATPQGVMGLAGNAWELTESEYTDGHTRFVMLRGGVFLPPGESEWLVQRGARPNDYHAKYLLLSDGLDRSDTISFRTVLDLE